MKHLVSNKIVTKPTTVTRTSKTLIDHIVVNFPQNITYTDVRPCSIVGDHDAPFACINVHLPRFKPRFKFLQNEKELDENAFKEDFSLLPLDVVYGLESPDDTVDALNSLMKDCLDRHDPLEGLRLHALLLLDSKLKKYVSSTEKESEKDYPPSLYSA